ncbi:fasciclin domain-containing protein [Pontivivens insulae]|uniref:Immunogenic protein MPB70 n=1 Tax=Pontivivens insulae TaxID=1639689 RepID=A0A2R8A646_9RHOB|nr:fasciclin domain-containing protein [Pontivivens insulae]RED17819.1 putative surface protein with fasciclin (FAS1) repeats [Pontivivens insulae]SPF27709.1 Immunogenic protein MPB70 [Pontivivens insulae]
MTYSLKALAASTALTAAIALPASADTIAEVASDASQFSTLVAAVGAADLTATLGDEGPFTVLAPNDEAFAKLPEGTVEMLLMPENKDQLVEILSYHVIPGYVHGGTITAAELDETDEEPLVFQTVQGQAIAFTESEIDNLPMVNDNAMIVALDIEASNGLIHEIDTVLMPEG